MLLAWCMFCSVLINPCGGVYMLLAWCMFCSVLIYLLVVYVYIAIAWWCTCVTQCGCISVDNVATRICSYEM